MGGGEAYGINRERVMGSDRQGGRVFDCSLGMGRV